VECVSVPLFPVIVKVLVPLDVWLVVFAVIAEVPEPVTEVGLKLALTPDGTAALRETVPENPPKGVTVTV
jgi:hypothetical protein